MRIGDLQDNRLLPDRARLEFHYPDGETILFLPFYQNPKITESQAANYVEYNPLARAGSLFVYTGAKSRKLKLDLIFTLPHLLEYDMGVGKFKRVFEGSSKEDQKALFSAYSNLGANQPPPPGGSSIALEVKKVYNALLIEQDPTHGMGSPPPEVAPNTTTQELGITSLGEIAQNIYMNTLPITQKDKAVDSLLFFVAMFRSAVLNNASNPLLGPPLIRLNFGTLYQSVPCILRNYNIAWEESAGYDLETLTPRQLNISLELVEVRVGDFGKFEPATYISRDNVAGWESVISSPHSVDPGYLSK